MLKNLHRFLFRDDYNYVGPVTEMVINVISTFGGIALVAFILTRPLVIHQFQKIGEFVRWVIAGLA